MNHSTKFGHPTHDNEQQQEAAALLLEQQQHYSNTQEQQQQQLQQQRQQHSVGIQVTHVQGGLRCGGLTPALTPRMPAIPRMYDMHYG